MRRPIKIVERLRESGAHDVESGLLGGVGADLASIDARGLGNDPATYRELGRRLAILLATADLSRLFQVDLVKPATRASIDPSVRMELFRAAEILRALAPQATENPFQRFREDFERRYGSREVPLLEALDENLGIGFAPETANDPSPILRTLSPRPEGSPAPGPWTDRDATLLRLVEEVRSRHETELVLSDEDLASLAFSDNPPLPECFAVMATLVAPTGGGGEGPFRVAVRSVSGPSGACLLGRFCESDETIGRGVEAHLRAEEASRPDVVFAEIVHLPEGRLGNILRRPVLRGHEIPYLGRSGAPLERQIPATDLRVSLHEGRVTLRSERLGREVLPRLTSAHNFGRSRLPVYRFLCGLQFQRVTSGLAWRWGPLDAARFFPRVRTGNAVLSVARWRLSWRDLGSFVDAAGGTRLVAIRRIRAELRVPRHLMLVESDHELPLDLENILCLDVLANLVKDRDPVIVFERFPSPEQLVASGPEGRFTLELAVPFERRVARTARSARSIAHPSAAGTVRTLAPGSSWLCVKAYGPPSEQDRVLARIHRDAIRPLLESGAVDCWFFLRYADPDPHLRLRLRGSPDRLDGEARSRIDAALRSLQVDGRVRGVQLDTYEREIERYGGPIGIELAERIFEADSEAAATILGVLDASDEHASWAITLRGIDALLGDLEFRPAEALALALRARDLHSKEYRLEKDDLHAIGDR